MALNNAFTVGQTLTAAECNNLPFGVADWATAASNYNITTTITAVPDITVTWTADSTRLYKITYYEPQVRSSTVSGAVISLELRSSTMGTQYNATEQTNGSAVAVVNGMTVIYISTFPDGTRTVLGAAKSTSTTGTPQLIHAGTQEPYIIVEDIGLA
jgi:hypothetical protein